MAHPEQAEFCKMVKRKYPRNFKNASVLDIGSLDINGNNHYLFEGGTYLGIDLGEGPNVDVVCMGHLFKPGRKYDTIISTECFEHDLHWRKTIMNAAFLTKRGGLFLFSCGGPGRQVHGTKEVHPYDSPFTIELFDNHYGTVSEEEVRAVEGFLTQFSKYAFGSNNFTKDLYFYGIKK